MSEESLLQSNCGSSIRVHPQGAHLTSWQPNPLLGEQIFVSEKSHYRSGTAIRGGVPICFPQFGNFGTIGKHGFARTSLWHETGRTEDSLTFGLSSNEQTLLQWPHEFDARFTTQTSAKSLIMSLEITNTGTKAFEFTAALHTYFTVSHYENIAIHGLKGCSYWDNGNALTERDTERRAELTLTGPLDRVYFDSKAPLTLVDKKLKKSISAEGFSDVVVWNPGAVGAADLEDLGNEEYTKMICIEAAVVDTPVALEAGETWRGSQTITILD